MLHDCLVVYDISMSINVIEVALVRTSPTRAANKDSTKGNKYLSPISIIQFHYNYCGPLFFNASLSKFLFIIIVIFENNTTLLSLD